MAQHRHLFVMDSVENLNLKLDSSLRMAQALLQDGHECFMTTISELSWQGVSTQQRVHISAIKLVDSDQDTPTLGDGTILEGSQIDAVYMRKDPPFNMEYLSCTWILSAMERWSTVFNHPGSLRDKNEKIIILDYPQYTQPALISCQNEIILDFIDKHCHGDAIIKPLDLYGGRGVERFMLSKHSTSAALEKLQQVTDCQSQLRIVQPFNHKIHDGEVRVFTAGGKIISWCLKVPPKGEFLANTRMGATIHPYQPSPKEEAMVLEVSGDLLDKGIFLVGYDLIGGYISEINITSPRLLLPPDVDPKPYYKELSLIISNHLQEKAKSLDH